MHRSNLIETHAKIRFGAAQAWAQAAAQQKNPLHRRAALSDSADRPFCDWAALAPPPLSWLAAEVFQRTPKTLRTSLSVIGLRCFQHLRVGSRRRVFSRLLNLPWGVVLSSGCLPVPSPGIERLCPRRGVSVSVGIDGGMGSLPLRGRLGPKGPLAKGGSKNAGARSPRLHRISNPAGVWAGCSRTGHSPGSWRLGSAGSRWAVPWGTPLETPATAPVGAPEIPVGPREAPSTGNRFRDYPDHSAADRRKTLAASGIPAIASSPLTLRVHAQPAG
jgi:hypothetical protein